jgi:SAM-dependent methyltransferase
VVVLGSRPPGDALTPIADSDAVLIRDRLLAQHQALLTLLQTMLADPQVRRFRWLDLACGKGQAIVHLRENLSEEARAKIDYFAVDIAHDYLRSALQTAEQCGFATVESKVAALDDLPQALPVDMRFDFLTLTNTTHEVRPRALAPLLLECIRRLSAKGQLFVYDMEELPSFELGAVTWTQAEISRLAAAGCRMIGAVDYVPPVGRWRHSSCSGWNLAINRAHLGVSDAGLADRLHPAQEQLGGVVRELLSAKRSLCFQGLSSLAKYGTETADEQRTKTRLLHDYWATSAALEGW